MGFRGPECSTCRRKDVEDIHRAIDGGDSIRGVASRYGIGESTLRLHLKHRQASAGPPAAPAPAARPKAPPSPPSPPAGGQRPPDSDRGVLPLDDLEGRLRQLAATADRLRDDAEDQGLTPRERGAALGEARRTVESMAKIAEALAEGRETKILGTPEWTSLRERIVEILAPWPEARAALEDGLREEAA